MPAPGRSYGSARSVDVGRPEGPSHPAGGPSPPSARIGCASPTSLTSGRLAAVYAAFVLDVFSPAKPGRRPVCDIGSTPDLVRKLLVRPLRWA